MDILLPLDARSSDKRQTRNVTTSVRKTKNKNVLPGDTIARKYIGTRLVEKIKQIKRVAGESNTDDTMQYIRDIYDELSHTRDVLEAKLGLVYAQSTLDEKKQTKEEIEEDIMDSVVKIREYSSFLADDLEPETIQSRDYRKKLLKIRGSIEKYDDSFVVLKSINRDIRDATTMIDEANHIMTQSPEVTSGLSKMHTELEYEAAIKWVTNYIVIFYNKYKNSIRDIDVGIIIDKEEEEEEEDTTLSELQRRCLDEMSIKARASSIDTVDTDGHLDRRVEYVRNRTVVSRQNIIKLLTGMIEGNDDTIKSCFVTNTTSSGGCPIVVYEKRISTESRLFNGILDSAPPEDRPIYGAINLIDDPSGASSCQHYDHSYVVFNDEVKSRMTLTETDSMVNDTFFDIGTFEYMNHIVDTRDADILDIYMARRRFSPDDADELQCDDYIEVQIHGRVSLARDITHFMIDPKLADNDRLSGLIDQFRVKYPSNVIFQIINGDTV